MKISQKLQMDVVSNQTEPYQAKPNHTIPNQLLKNSQNKSDLDETFTEPSDGHCLKLDQIKHYQTNSKSSLKQPKQVRS